MENPTTAESDRRYITEYVVDPQLIDYFSSVLMINATQVIPFITPPFTNSCLIVLGWQMIYPTPPIDII